jgi:hypothetical protein
MLSSCTSLITSVWSPAWVVFFCWPQFNMNPVHTLSNYFKSILILSSYTSWITSDHQHGLYFSLDHSLIGTKSLLIGSKAWLPCSAEDQNILSPLILYSFICSIVLCFFFYPYSFIFLRTLSSLTILYGLSVQFHVLCMYVFNMVINTYWQCLMYRTIGFQFNNVWF